MAAKHTWDRAVAILAAASTPTVALLIDTHVISATVGVDVGSIITAAVAAYHGGALIQRRQATLPDRPAGQ